MSTSLIRRNAPDESNLTLESVGEFERVANLIVDYRGALKGGNNLSAIDLLEEIIISGVRFQAGEKLFKLAQGMILSAVKSTTGGPTYRKVCEERFGITPQTADRYVLIYDALLSGEFLYSLPIDPDTGESYNLFDLSIRDMESAAELIISGEFTEEAAHILFSAVGNWIEKREEAKRTSNEDKKEVTTRRKKKSPLTVSAAGDIFFAGGRGNMRIGFLDVESNDMTIRGIALRLKNVIIKEFK